MSDLYVMRLTTAILDVFSDSTHSELLWMEWFAVLKVWIAAQSVIMMVGCSAFLVPETHNPYIKLEQAKVMAEIGRPLAVDLLISQAIEMLKLQNDRRGLAFAYRQYAFFLKSSLVEQRKESLVKYGFKDKSVTYGTRYRKSLEYLETSRDLFLELDIPGELTNVYYNLAVGCIVLGKSSEACENFEKSIIFYKENIKRNPRTKVVLPKGASDFVLFVESEKKRIGCM